ncbi:MAG: 16S rRNA (uracil(1498)-N(3))-methyltransferase [Hyphomicrobiaceae bacterium]
MAIHDFNAQRLFLDASLVAGEPIAATREQANYLLNVMRLTSGDRLLAFNGRDGEWLVEVVAVGKRGLDLVPLDAVRAQTPPGTICYLFAPLKRARLDYMVQKAVEMGVGRLSPVMTRRTVAERVNLERMRANAIEAAEQCGIISLPDIDEPLALAKVLDGWDASIPLVVCDETAVVANPIAALAGVRKGPVGLLVGPEGGFAREELEMIRAMPCAVAISLGPRIMRADTAAVAALGLLNATVGDWG